MKTKESFATGCLVVFGWFFFAFLSAAWSGYVLSILWAWFIVPPFHLPALTVWQAVGFAATVRIITVTQIAKSKDDEVLESIGYALLVPLFFLFFGWVAKQFL